MLFRFSYNACKKSLEIICGGGRRKKKSPYNNNNNNNKKNMKRPDSHFDGLNLQSPSMRRGFEIDDTDKIQAMMRPTISNTARFWQIPFCSWNFLLDCNCAWRVCVCVCTELFLSISEMNVDAICHSEVHIQFIGYAIVQISFTSSYYCCETWMNNGHSLSYPNSLSQKHSLSCR